MHCNSNSLQLQSEEELDLQDWLHYQETPNTPPLPTNWSPVFCVLCETWRRSPCFSRKCSAASRLLYSPGCAAAVDELTRPPAYQSVSSIHSSYLPLCAVRQSCGQAMVRLNCWGNLASAGPLANTNCNASLGWLVLYQFYCMVCWLRVSPADWSSGRVNSGVHRPLYGLYTDQTGCSSLRGRGGHCWVSLTAASHASNAFSSTVQSCSTLWLSDNSLQILQLGN